MNWNELKRIAIDYGWRLKKHGKRHDIYYHPEKEYFIEIERHWSDEVKRGICHDLLKLIKR